MAWNEEGGGGLSTSTIYELRSRSVVGPSKRKRSRPLNIRRFKPSIALQQEIDRLAAKLKPKPPCHDVPAYWPNMVTESDMVSSDSDTDSESHSSDDLSPVSTSEFPLSSPSTSTLTHRTPKVVDHSHCRLKDYLLANIETYTAMAKLALEYYNFMQHANLKFVEVTAASEDSDSVKRMHINFIATFDGHSRILLFAELINDRLRNSDLTGYYVQGCCVIEKVDSGNPLGTSCYICSSDEGPSEGVQHPGPFYGYRIVSGDVFRGYVFWEYHPFAYEKPPRPKFKPMQSAESAIYVVSANKALEYFNSKQQQLTKFKDAEATAGAHQMTEFNGTVVHINFLARRFSGSEQELFFAVLSVPPFDIERDWDDWKEPFVVVEACCRLEKIDSGNPFGRVCGLCRFYNVGRVIHPSPRDGYTAADGDDFAGYDFMTMGTGIY